MNKYLKQLQKLGEFNNIDLEDNEDFKDVYIKLKGQRLCKITNYPFDNYNGCVYRVIGTQIHKKETYNEWLDLEIPNEKQEWEDFATITFIGKKEDYESIKPNYKKLYEEAKKALEIIKKKGINLYKLKICDSCEEYNQLCNTDLPLTQEEYDLLKEVLK